MGQALLPAKEKKKQQDAAIDQWRTCVQFESRSVGRTIKEALHPSRRLGFLAPKHRTALVLSYRWLPSLPAEIGEIAGLQELDLRSNQLQDLPAAIGRLSTLRRLNLVHNRFSHVPATLLELPADCEIDLRHNPLPAQAIQATRAEVWQRSQARRPAPRFRLPPIAADKGTLREVAESDDYNTHFAIIYGPCQERLDGMIREHANETGDAQVDSEPRVRLSQAMHDHARKGPQQALRTKAALEGYFRLMSDRSIPDAYNESGYYFQGREDESGFSMSADAVLRHVAFNLDAQIRRTPSAHQAEATENAAELVVEALADGKNDCTVGKCEALIQIIGVPLSRHAVKHPEVIGTAAIPHTPQQVRDLILDAVKHCLELNDEFSGPGAARGAVRPPSGFRRYVSERFRMNHSWIPADTVDRTLREIEAEWPTFFEMVTTQHARRGAPN